MKISSSVHIFNFISHHCETFIYLPKELFNCNLILILIIKIKYLIL